mgnify:FL=1
MQTVVSENVSYVNSTLDEISYNELNKRVTLLVEQLPPKCKEVYQLSRGRGLNNKEIALQLAISHNTVKTHLAKALGHLREYLPEYDIPKRFTRFLFNEVFRITNIQFLLQIVDEG